MLAQVNASPIPQIHKLSGDTPVPVTVIAAAGASPTIDPPAFSYKGLDTGRSIWIEANVADFTLTLSPAGLPPGYAMTFAPMDPDGTGPITWRSPGAKQPVRRPDYISPPVLSKDSMALTFTVTNTATPGNDVLISFTLSVLVTGRPTPERDLRVAGSDDHQRRPAAGPAAGLRRSWNSGVHAQGIEPGEGEPARRDPLREGPVGVDQGGGAVADQGVDQRRLEGGLRVALGEEEDLLDGLDGAPAVAEVREGLGAHREELPARRGRILGDQGEEAAVESFGLGAVPGEQEDVGEVQGDERVGRLERQGLPEARLGLRIAPEEQVGGPEVGDLGDSGRARQQPPRRSRSPAPDRRSGAARSGRAATSRR